MVLILFWKQNIPSDLHLDMVGAVIDQMRDFSKIKRWSFFLKYFIRFEIDSTYISSDLRFDKVGAVTG